MAKFIIEGGNVLVGDVTVSGGKNAVLPIMAASIMADSPCVLHNAPNLIDVKVMTEMLREIGVIVEKSNSAKQTLNIDPTSLNSHVVNETLVRQVRSSIFLMGPLTAKLGKAKMSYPGGCNIGLRPIDQHLKGLRALGVNFTKAHGQIIAVANRLRGTDIHLDIPSVGATENTMMCAVLANGVTIIRNAAKEPEIVDLQNFLNTMGAKIHGAGTDIIRIEGVKHLKGCEYTIMPDRIEVGTLMIASAITEGDIYLRNALPEHVQAVISKLREAGTIISFQNNGIRVKGSPEIKPIDLMTLPYPGFPTDIQPQMMALTSIAKGTSVISETIFESRFKQAEELGRMGAKIRTEGRTAIIKGVPNLSGAKVVSSDLRSGASLVLAGLSAEGKTTVSNIENVDRGYERLEQKLTALGATISRVK